MISRKRRWKIVKKKPTKYGKSALREEIQKSQERAFQAKLLTSDKSIFAALTSDDLNHDDRKKDQEKELSLKEQLQTRKLNLYNSKSQEESQRKKKIVLNATWDNKLGNLQTKFDLAESTESISKSKSNQQNVINSLLTIADKNIGFSAQEKNNTAGSFKDRNSKSYAIGTCINFKSEIAFQKSHGGFLSFYRAANIRASAHMILPTSKFCLYNCLDPTDEGPVRYGDAVYLQAGTHEVLGARYSGGDTGIPGAPRRICPALVNSRHSNEIKAQTYGRWILINFNKTSESMGKEVKHGDCLMLEQEWNYLASKSPYDAYLETYVPREKKQTYFTQSDNCSWKIHLVTLPSDRGKKSKSEHLLVLKANRQLEKCSENAKFFKDSPLNFGTLKSTLPESMLPENIVKTMLAHTIDKKLLQKKLLAKFDKQTTTNFEDKEKEISNELIIKAAYGEDSFLYKSLSSVQSKKNVEVIDDSYDNLERAENEYWNYASKLLVNSKSWDALGLGLKKYDEIVLTRKQKALKVLREFFIFCIHKVIWKRRLKLSEDKAFNIYLKKNSTNKKPAALFLSEEDKILQPDVRKARPSTAPSRMSRQMKDINYYYSTFSNEKQSFYQNSVSSSAFATVSQMMFDGLIQNQTVSKTLTCETLQENAQQNNNLDSKKLTINTTKAQEGTFIVGKSNAINRLSKTPSRDYGLPQEIFIDHKENISLRKSVKFLKHFSSSPQIFSKLSASPIPRSKRWM